MAGMRRLLALLLFLPALAYSATTASVGLAAADILTIGVVREGAVSFDPRATLAWAEFR